jgi:nitrogen regulatory protein PII 2
MKMIIAMIRIDKMNETKKALTDAGMPSFTATGRVYGRGKGKYDAKVMEGVKQGLPEAISLLGPEPPLRPQRLITLVVPGNEVKKAVTAIIEANCTESHGDGKIFVMPCSEAIRIRTKEIEDAALI